MSEVPFAVEAIVVVGAVAGLVSLLSIVIAYAFARQPEVKQRLHERRSTGRTPRDESTAGLESGREEQ